MTVASSNGRQSVGTLLRDLAEGSVALVRAEVRLARIETMEALGGATRGAALVATAAVLALLGSLALLAGIILLIGDQWLPRDLYWVAALAVVVLTGGLAVLFLKRGLAHFSAEALLPDETVEELRETKDELVAAIKQ